MRKKDFEPPECSEIDCEELGAVIVDGKVRCGEHGLEDYKAGKVEHNGRVKGTIQ